MSKTFDQWVGLDVKNSLELLESTSEGLSVSQAKERLQKYGPNEFIKHDIGWWDVLRRQFTSPFTLILVVVTMVSFALGQMIDGLMVLLFLVINVSLSFFQEYRSERSIKLLKKFITTKTHVMRGGKEELVEGRSIVPGDIILIEAGDIVPADVRLIEVTNCTIDESSLTGESISVEKSVEPINTHEIFKAQCIAFSGTHVLVGRALGVVFATGLYTEIGSIAQLTDQAKRVSGFETSITAYSQVILRVIFFTLLIVIGLNIAIKRESIDLFSLLFFCIALAISVIPEGLPVVTTLALSQGALMLAKLKVVVKRLSAIEDLGSIEVLCTDKTGTLTENVLSVADVFTLRNDKRELIMIAAVGSSFLGRQKKEPNNSFNIALWKQLSDADKKMARSITFELVLPFDPMRRRSTVVIVRKDHHEIVVRGVPELLIKASNASSAEKKNALAWASDQGKKGMRVLAVTKKVSKTTVKEIKGEMDIEGGELVGVIAFEDPLKSSAVVALRRAKELGVQVKILTGDSAEVSTHVAQKVGLIQSSDEVITGEAFENLSPLEQHEAVVSHHVFARISPEQKHAIIHILQDHQSVGFLGEGINDAPALKTAQVGIVVHGASDIATQAADVVLLDNDLGVIVDGIQKGREVFANTVKYIQATLSSNFGNFFAVAVASLLSSNLPMLPLQILLLNLLSDLPMISIATDTVDPDELHAPKKYQVHEVVALASILGIVSSFFDFTFFAIFSHQNPANLQTYWFIGSVLTELAFIYSIRVQKFFLTSVRPSVLLIGLSVVAAITSIVVPFTAFGQRVFEFIHPTAQSMGIVMFIVVLYFVVTEAAKLAYYSFAKKIEVKVHV
ncbi:MAG: cation-transporting P-type ATPase [Patescibacteria group bacterium]